MDLYKNISKRLEERYPYQFIFSTSSFYHDDIFTHSIYLEYNNAKVELYNSCVYKFDEDGVYNYCLKSINKHVEFLESIIKVLKIGSD